MKSFSEIQAESVDISRVLVNAQHYWAHINQSEPEELLQEHVSLVNKYASELVKIHGLNPVIDLIAKSVVEGGSFSEKDACALLIKRLMVNTILFHDFGKVNENFQAQRMGNKRFKAVPTTLIPPFGHSFLGAYMFLFYHVDEIVSSSVFPDNEKVTLILFTYFFSFVIVKHHSPVLDSATNSAFISSFQKQYKDLMKYIQLYQFNKENELLLNSFFDNANDILEGAFEEELLWQQEGGKRYISFPLYSLIKMSSSLLTSADYLATHEYSSGTGLTDFGILNSPERREELINSLRSYKHNVTTYAEADNYQFSFPEKKSNENLNILRKEMAIEVLNSIKSHIDKYLFYLEAPTGGGKTNISMIVLSELLAKHPEITKVFYVFPFTTLITQTYKALKDSFGLDGTELVELHSKAPININDTEYNEEKSFIDNLFALYPFTVLSHVKFFDILKTNHKESNYLLHRMANSVVIIDELQSYNPAIWDRMLYLIGEYSRLFNIRFLLMSATLPRLGVLDIHSDYSSDFVELLPNSKRYLQNPNFSRRVVFKFDFFEKKIDMETLVDTILKKSEEYKCRSENQTVHTIVEFIFKRSASEFYRAISATKHPFDKIFILSGTILESRRKEIINYIKNKEHRNENILLITTQVVEAGVDIDMDLGFKNLSLIDSDEQLAGRVNRNATKETADVYLFRMDDASVLYSKDLRYKATRENISLDEYKGILAEKDFSKLYELVFPKIDALNKSTSIQNFVSEFMEKGINRLDFRKVDDDFKIIDQQSHSVFVPLALPIKIDSYITGEQEDIFTKEELLFLERMSVYPVNEHIDGAEVWGLYESLIQKRTEKFDIKEKIYFKILQVILSKYCFSLISNSKDYRSIAEGFGNEELGYLYFSYWNDERTGGVPYDYKSGLNSDAFSDIQFI